MILHNYAVGGASIAPVPDRGLILDQVNMAKNNGIDSDYIILEGLANDAIGGRTTLGGMSDSFEGPFDMTTFGGNLEETIKTIKGQWGDKKLIFVRVHNMNSRSDLQIAYGELAQQICNKWGISVVNLYEGGLNTHVEADRIAYTNKGDGTHPNDLGYRTYYVPAIEAQMLAMLGS